MTAVYQQLKSRIRSSLSYDTVITKLQSGEELIVDDIKFNSIFNDMKSFHVCNPGLPLCTAHDLFEGVVAYDPPMFVQYFVRKKFQTVDILNKRIE